MFAQRKAVVSLKSIADETKVSVATVSRILRGTDQCSSATRQRVTEVAKRLRYRPNLLVQGLQQGRTGTVGVIAHIFDEFFAAIATGIHHGLVRGDCVPIFLWSGAASGAPSGTDELTQIHRLVDRRVDGIILQPHQDWVGDEYLNDAWDRGIPLVTIDRELEATSADFVGTDDAHGTHAAVEHLLSLGHRRIGHLAGPQHVSTGALRKQAFEAALRSTPDASGEVVVDDSFGGKDARDAAMTLLRSPLRPTAVFCGNDFQAAAVYSAAAELGLRIPDDLSVVGFADLSLAACMTPQLTTVRQRPEDIGRLAAEFLLDRINGDYKQSAPRKVRLNPELVTRGSTGPCNTARAQ